MFRFFNVAIIAFVLMLNINIAVAHDCPSNTYAEPVSTLDPDIEPTDYTSSPINGGNGTWDVTAPYGHVTGIATCNTTSGSWGTAYPQYNFEQGTEGQYCWCKMLEPSRSAWVYYDGSSSAADCAANCAYYCGSNVRIYAGFRGGVFGSAYQCVANSANDCPVGTHQDNTPLDPDIEPTSYTYNETNKTWDVTAPYGHVTGIATCNTTPGSWGTAYPQYNFEQGTEGQYCWCKMLEPSRSAWVYASDSGLSSAADCAADCAFYCGRNVRYIADFRRGVFGSVTEDICTPNTININWQDATGTTQESNTCTYGVTLSTPATAPTKRGYTFVGWSYQ